MYHDIFIAGTGGQGVLVIGNLLAEAALAEGREVTFLPSYGVEMRGGNANCTVIIADHPIGSPSINTPQTLMLMSRKTRPLYEPKVLPDGLYILNTSLVPESDVARKDVRLVALPFNDLATEMGNARLANMIALGVYVGRTDVVSVAALEEGMAEVLSERNRQYIPQNMAAIRRGLELADGGVR
jgi:2-oxoglutarate ferredoxin oxidoreductase subunit gamma